MFETIEMVFVVVEILLHLTDCWYCKSSCGFVVLQVWAANAAESVGTNFESSSSVVAGNNYGQMYLCVWPHMFI